MKTSLLTGKRMLKVLPIAVMTLVLAIIALVIAPRLVLAIQTPPTVTSNPQDTSVTYGGNATFTADASGTPTPTVQWQVSTDGGSTFSNISGATSYNLTVVTPPVSYTGYEYHAVFTNKNGSATTTVATLTISQLTISVRADAQSKTYGAADPELTYTYTPALIGSDTFNGALTRDVGEDVGTYAINQGTLTLSSNYILDYTGADLMVEPNDTPTVKAGGGGLRWWVILLIVLAAMTVVCFAVWYIVKRRQAQSYFR